MACRDRAGTGAAWRLVVDDDHRGPDPTALQTSSGFARLRRAPPIESASLNTGSTTTMCAERPEPQSLSTFEQHTAAATLTQLRPEPTRSHGIAYVTPSGTGSPTAAADRQNSPVPLTRANNDPSVEVRGNTTARRARTRPEHAWQTCLQPRSAPRREPFRSALAPRAARRTGPQRVRPVPTADRPTARRG